MIVDILLCILFLIIVMIIALIGGNVIVSAIMNDDIKIIFFIKVLFGFIFPIICFVIVLYLFGKTGCFDILSLLFEEW